MSDYVERGEVLGLVTLVSRHGEAHADTIGTKSIGGAAIGRDAISELSPRKPL
jgi:hypothetical protein